MTYTICTECRKMCPNFDVPHGFYFITSKEQEMTYGGWGDGGGMRAREKACKSITKLVDIHSW